MNPSQDKTRPIIRLVGLIVSIVVFAFLWSGDQKVQAEIAAARAKSRPVYAGPAVLRVTPTRPTIRVESLASRPNQLPAGEYLLQDHRGQIGRLIVGPQTGSLPVSTQLTITTTRGKYQLKPVQTVSASELLYR